MKIKALQEAIMLSRDAGVTLFIWGHRGLGKSQVTEQTATLNRMGFSDMRLSQCEASDLRGMPLADAEGNRTIFLPPADLPVGGLTWDEFIEKLDIWSVLEDKIPAKDLNDLLKQDPTLPENALLAVQVLKSYGYLTEADTLARNRARLLPQLNEGILFLDEINRAQDDVIQAAFQLLLDRRLGTYVLPAGWSIVTAGNFNEGYVTNGFTDPAFLDRFAHVTLDGGELTLEEWVGYISSKHGVAAMEVIEYASQNTKHLDGDIKGELGFAIQPSRRSWEFVIKVLKSFAAAKGKYSEEAKMAILAGLVGNEAALNFTRYTCPVRPKDLIERGVAALESKLRELTRNQKTGLSWGLVSFLKGKVDDEKLAKVAMDFARWVAKNGKDKDIAVAFCNLMVGGSDLRARSALVSNPSVANLISKFRPKDSKKTFADRLAEDSELQNLVSSAAWGKE
jgi:MoxR-like ATPase